VAARLERVFGDESRYQGELYGPGGDSIGSGMPTDYVLFSSIGKLRWYAADRSRWLSGNDEMTRRESKDRLSEKGCKPRTQVLHRVVQSTRDPT
jgi:hypothetical protein